MEPDSDSEKFPGSSDLTELASSELLHLWRSGNELAAAILVDRYALRLVALVARRLDRRSREVVEPEDVVQSAMGSFFDAAHQSRLRVSDSVSLWRLLATFARRKLARSIEKHSAAKRGAGLQRVSIDSAAQQLLDDSLDAQAVRDFRETLDAEMPEELHGVLEGLIANRSQSEIADSLGVTERTVRRHIVRIREILRPLTPEPQSIDFAEFSSASLPKVDYHEFVLGRLIGAGGFGKVYRGSLQSDGSVVAVKFLRKAFWENGQAKLSFLREIDAAARIDHPGVNRYLGWGLSPHGGPYVLSDWIDGKTLEHCKMVGPARFVSYLQQICDALIAVHDSGVVHGDITPGNILVDNYDRILLTDFGFSQAKGTAHGEGSLAAEPESVFGGTIGFAAPEQLSPAFGTIGRATDCYAVGGLAFWYLSGKSPHHADRMDGSFADTISTANVDVSNLECPAEAARMIRNVADAALRKPVAHRPSSMADLARLLQA